MKIIFCAISTGSVAPNLTFRDHTEKSPFTDSETWMLVACGQLGKLRQVRKEAL